MASVTCASLRSTLLFLSVFVFVSAEQKTITAESGQNVILPGRAPNNSTILGVEWSRADLGSEYVLLYRGRRFDPENQHPSFVNRVDLQDRQMKDGDVSLILKNVTAADAGTYECRVIQRRTKRRKRANLKTEPISIISLRVDPPGPGGGSARLIVGLSVSALLLLVAVVLLIYRKRKQKPRSHSPYQRPGEAQPSVELQPV